MKIKGQHTFDASRATVWKAVMDPEVIAKVMPGCEALEEIGDNAYEGVMKIKVGPVQGKFKGTVEISDISEPESYHIQVKGKGAPGFVEAEGDINFADEGGKTRLDYEMDAKVGGRIASVGQRLLESSTKVITRQSLEGLEAQIEALEDAGESGEPPREVAAPSQTQMAAGFATGLIEEMIPEPARPIAGIAVGNVIGVLMIGMFYLIFQACSGS